MSMNAQRDAFFAQAATSQDLESLGNILQIFWRGAFGPPAAQIGLLMIAAELLAEADDSQVVLDHRLARCRILEVRVASARASGDGGEPDSDRIGFAFQSRGIVGIELGERSGEGLDVI